jgi:hypothetical protein
VPAAPRRGVNVGRVFGSPPRCSSEGKSRPSGPCVGARRRPIRSGCRFVDRHDPATSRKTVPIDENSNFGALLRRSPLTYPSPAQRSGKF